MKEKLELLVKNAYSPYYNFKVAAIVEMEDGNLFTGVNVENANGTSICAERNAVSAAVSHGYKKSDFKKIHIYAEKSDEVTPCFACRQVLIEFFKLDSEVIIYKKDGTTTTYLLKELCPHIFGEDSLK